MTERPPASAVVRNREVLAVQKPLLTVEEAARALNVQPAEVYALLARGELPVVRIGRAVRIPTPEVERRIALRASASRSKATAGPDDGEVEA